MNKSKGILQDERGVTNTIALLIVLPTLLVITFSIVTYSVFVMQQMKLEAILFWTLQLVEEEGKLTSDIKKAASNKLKKIGFSDLIKDGKRYPSFEGSTAAQVLKDDPDPTVKVRIRYPASSLQKIFSLIGEGEEETGYFELTGYGRSEAYE